MNRLLCAIASVVTIFFASTINAAGQIAWQPWSDSVFEKARKENRFVLLDLEAVWCHWCHVMEHETYQDARVTKLVEKHYIAVRVDQDARPDLSRRYEDYGWPATIIFAPDGSEIVKRAGFIPADRFARMLEAIVADPSPMKYRDSEPVGQYSTTPLLPESLRATLRKAFFDTHDFRLGGMKQEQKFMDRDSVELALMLARAGDPKARQMAVQTLQGSMNLIDPAWGGMYQYSTHRDWKHPHFEKIMFVQADSMRVYAQAALALGDARYLQAARAIHRYVAAFLLSPEGAFYASQDADLIRGQHSEGYFALTDPERRKLGIPQVDKHLYARENGWIIQGLAALYAAGGDTAALDQARGAARWVLDNRAMEGGGFRHDQTDAAGPYLEDTLAMGRGFLALYQVTGEREWLRHAEHAARFIRGNFAAKDAGFISFARRTGSVQPFRQTDENIMMARFANALLRYTGNEQYRADAKHAMRYLVTPEIALKRRSEAGILLADSEISSDPTHLTVVGSKADAAARTLFIEAQRHPSGYKRIEWWDRTEGAMPNPDVQYPELPKAAAYVCSENRCSLPVFDSGGLLDLAERLSK